MILLMFLGLYTSRVTLKVLGAEDFGIYNVVGGIVVLFLFFTSALTSGIQRYLNFYLGENDETSLKKIFSQSYLVIVILALIILVLSESVGILLLEKYMVIPPERMNAARVIYQLSILSTIFMILKIPFNATIIAYEHMSFFAYTSLIEGGLKLACVLVLPYVLCDRLILYAVFTMSVPLILYITYFIYCKIKFPIINFKRYKDKDLLKGIVSFSGWNIVGSAANILCKQGLNVVINRFFGVTINAAMGIANQVNTAIYSFLSNFQTAFNPHIVKSYAQKEMDTVFDFSIKTSKYSFFMLFFIILPFSVNIDFVLDVWLDKVPDYSNIFTLCLCVFTLIDSLYGPLWMLVEAEGNIKQYQLVGGISGLMVLPVTYVCFALKLPSYSGLVVHNVQLFAFMIWRLFYLKKRMAFPVGIYCKEVFLRLIFIIPLGLIPTLFVHWVVKNTIASFFASCITSCVVLAVLYLTIGVSKDERAKLFSIIKTKVFKK